MTPTKLRKPFRALIMAVVMALPAMFGADAVADKSQAEDLPFEIRLSEELTIRGRIRFFGGAAVMNMAVLWDDVDRVVIGEFDLNPATSTYLLKSELCQLLTGDETVMVTGGPHTPTGLAPGGGGALPFNDTFFGLLARSYEGDELGTLVAATGAEVDETIANQGNEGTENAIPAVCDLFETLPMVTEWVFKLSNDERVHYRIYRDGSLEVVVKRLDENGCWYWSLFPITTPPPGPGSSDALRFLDERGIVLLPGGFVRVPELRDLPPLPPG